MLKRIILFVLVFPFVLMSAEPKSNAFVGLSVDVSSTKVPQNQNFTVNINIHYDNEHDYQFESPILSGTRNCEIMGTGVENSVILTNGKSINIRKYSYTLKPIGMGQAYFGSVSIRYVLNSSTNTLYTKDVPVTVTFPKIKKKSKLPIILGIILIILLTGWLVFVIILKLKERKKQKQISLEKEREASITLEEKKYQIFLTLKEDKDKLDAEGYFFRLVKILKEYIMEKFEIKQKSLTEKEVLPLIPDDYEEKKVIQLWFEKSYNIKFGNFNLSETDAVELENFISQILKS